jgi:very-short-patch-repair endonuclease
LALRLRRSMSLPEVLLWKAIKARRLDGLHFRRQHPVGPYILCDSARLCIEVDGYAHGTGGRPARDGRRDSWLAEQGIRTLRLRAALILEDVDAAVGTIRQTLES